MKCNNRECSNELPTGGSGRPSVYCSRSCLIHERVLKAQDNRPARTCQDCGVPVTGMALYCPDCGRKRMLETKRKSQKKRDQTRYANHVGDKKVCQICGAVFTMTSTKQLYCKPKWAHKSPRKKYTRSAKKLSARMVAPQPEYIATGIKETAAQAAAHRRETQIIETIVSASMLPGYDKYDPAPFIEIIRKG